ncbi:hypothetical protein EYF80_020700 [Liparis tanakae]|uniref:Uncharacterized protein n=1 Tax=Liparis tanakae TaxID=230148 RepID=A0A4Z2HTW5_9TELE|nr:hypothetical protein EYF80_020700 [Liparis tanakae]
MLISAHAESPHGVQTLVVVSKNRHLNANWRSLGWRRVAMMLAETTTDSNSKHNFKVKQNTSSSDSAPNSRDGDGRGERGFIGVCPGMSVHEAGGERRAAGGSLRDSEDVCRLAVEVSGPSSRAVDDGAALEALDVLLGLVEARLLLGSGRRALHQLHEVVAVDSVHDAAHPPAVVTDPLQVLPFAGEGLR